MGRTGINAIGEGTNQVGGHKAPGPPCTPGDRSCCYTGGQLISEGGVIGQSTQSTWPGVIEQPAGETAAGVCAEAGSLFHMAAMAVEG